MKKVELYAGCTIDKALDEIKKESELAGEVCYGVFNGKDIVSTDTLDEAYMRVLGRTKAEQEQKEREWKDEYDRKEAEYKAKIPELTEKYRQEARGLVRETELEYWDEIVPIRLNDLYHGMELRCTLDIIKIVRDGQKNNVPQEDIFKSCREEFEKQGHSVMSAGLMFHMLVRFCPFGAPLVEVLKQ